MATYRDKNGGGHKNACGCRIQPLTEDGEPITRVVNNEDIERNLESWLKLWRDRQNTILI